MCVPLEHSLNCRIVTLALVALVTWLYLGTRRPRGLPPGPPVFPVIGSLTFLTGDGATFVSELNRLHKEYGKMFSVKAGPA